MKRSENFDEIRLCLFVNFVLEVDDVYEEKLRNCRMEREMIALST